MHDSAHSPRTALTAAGLPFASIDVKRMLKISKFSIGLPEIAKGRSARLNRILKHLANDGHQGRNTWFCNAPRLATWRDASAKQCFTNVDIAQSCDNFLVQER